MTNQLQPIVAIDGPAGSGKSTVATELARRTGLQFISSGSLYRAVALLADREGASGADRERLIDIAARLPISFATDAGGVVHTYLGHEDVTDDLRTPRVSQIAAVIAAIPDVRAHLVAKLREYGRDGGLVMEGRDIQTVVFPDAELKIFLTASTEERARRRWKQLRAAGGWDSFEDVLNDERERDRRDIERDASPLRAAADAIQINTDGMTIDQVVDCLVRLVDAWRAHPNAARADLIERAGCGAAAAAAPTRGA